MNKNARLKNKPIISESSYYITVPSKRVIDINAFEDWQIAEKMFGLINN